MPIWDSRDLPEGLEDCVNLLEDKERASWGRTSLPKCKASAFKKDLGKYEDLLPLASLEVKCSWSPRDPTVCFSSDRTPLCADNVFSSVLGIQYKHLQGHGTKEQLLRGQNFQEKTSRENKKKNLIYLILECINKAHLLHWQQSTRSPSGNDYSLKNKPAYPEKVEKRWPFNMLTQRHRCCYILVKTAVGSFGFGKFSIREK
ncbi:uncharacterized protein LOC144229748 [Crocuta crocuta]